MKILVFASLLYVASAAYPYGWGHNDDNHDGQWRGEGLAESQDHGQWNPEPKQTWTNQHYAPQHKWNPAPIGHDGTVVDTPEVAKAKAAHIKALEHARSHAPTYNNHQHWNHEPKWTPTQHWTQPEPHGVNPPAWNPQPHWSGAVHQEQNWAHHHNHNEEPKWNGPLARIELTHDGRNVKDTAEVAHARAAHLAAVAAAAAAAASKNHGYAHAHAPAYFHNNGPWYNHN